MSNPFVNNNNMLNFSFFFFLSSPTHAQCARLATGLCSDSTVSPAVQESLTEEISRLWALFDQTDASMLEINPLAELDGDQILWYVFLLLLLLF